MLKARENPRRPICRSRSGSLTRSTHRCGSRSWRTSRRGQSTSCSWLLRQRQAVVKMTSDSVLVRQRVAEALSRAGLHERSVMAEVLMLLPSAFLTEYETLFLETWSGASGQVSIGDADAEKPVPL